MHVLGVGPETKRGELYCPTCEQVFDHGDRCPTDQTRLVRLADSGDQLIGRDIDGRFTIVEKVGQGGMGSVYRATQHSVGRDVAIKVVSPRLVSEPVVIKRFLREANLASRLSHPNAVAVHDSGQTEDGLFYLVMELVTGRTLEQALVADGTLAPSRIIRIGSQICDVLESAHELQIVHRDLKPQNVMLMTSGRDFVKVLDFGLAKSLTPETMSTATHAGALLGTPAYMPPELVLGQSCDARSDLYSLGCMLYLCASGRLPFVTSSVHELISMHATEQAPPITGLPGRLGAVIEKLLAKDPVRRYQSATETREALESAVSDEDGGQWHSHTPVQIPRSSTVAGIPTPRAPARPAPDRSDEAAPPSVGRAVTGSNLPRLYIDVGTGGPAVSRTMTPTGTTAPGGLAPPEAVTPAGKSRTPTGLGTIAISRTVTPTAATPPLSRTSTRIPVSGPIIRPASSPAALDFESSFVGNSPTVELTALDSWQPPVATTPVVSALLTIPRPKVPVAPPRTHSSGTPGRPLMLGLLVVLLVLAGAVLFVASR